MHAGAGERRSPTPCAHSLAECLAVGCAVPGVYFADNTQLSLSYAQLNMGSGNPRNDPSSALDKGEMQGRGTLAVCEIINETRYQVGKCTAARVGREWSAGGVRVGRGWCADRVRPGGVRCALAREY